MTQLAIERGVIIPAGLPNSGVSMQPTEDGRVLFALLHEGVRILMLVTPEEAATFGVGFIECGHAAKMQAQAAVKPVSPIVLNGVGRG